MAPGAQRVLERATRTRLIARLAFKLSGMRHQPQSISNLPLRALVGELRNYAVMTLDPEGYFTSWNAGVGELLGYEEDEFVGQPGGIIFTLEDRAKGEQEKEMAVARATGEAIDDRWHLRKDGSRVWVNGIMHCVSDEAGNVLGYVKLLRDQTDKLLLDAHLAESEERFSKAFRSNPTPTAVLTLPDLTVVEVNDAYVQSFQVSRPAVLNQAFGGVGLEVAADALEPVRRELQQGRPLRTEMPYLHPEGAQGHGTFAFEPIELGGVPHVVMLMHDMTAWRRAHEQLERQNRFLAALLNSVPGIFYMMEGRRLVQWNDEFERVTGRSAGELATATATDVLEDPDAIFQHVETALRTGQSSIEGNVRRKDGQLLPYLLTGRRFERNGSDHVIGIGVDIARLVEERAVLERQTRELAAFAELGGAALAADELQPVLERAASRVRETLNADEVRIVELGSERPVVRAAALVEGGISAGIREGARPTIAWRLPDAEAGPLPPEELSAHGLGSGIRARIQGRDRQFGYIEALGSGEGAFTDEDLGFIRSVSYLLAGAVEQLRLQGELAHRADHDDLTGLLTRITFERRLVDALARADRERSSLAVLFIDLDRFKNVNDSLGHQAGDEVLRTAARRLRDSVRSWDVVARHGGDEFVLFMPDVSSGAEIAHFTNRLLDAFREPFDVGGRQIRVAATVGIAFYPTDGDDVASLLRAADSALYEGKTRGRNTFHFYTREQNEKVKERLELEALLRRALDQDELDVAYLPQVDLSSGEARVAEALVRWSHPTRGPMAPSAFLPVVEAIGLAVPVGEWMFMRAFADHAAWRALPGAPVKVAVNVSSLHFLQPSFPETLLALASDAGVEPHEIELEFTEPALVKDLELSTSHLVSLRTAGVGMVIDDFGTSASPLAHLRDLPVDRLKIDQTFTHRLADPLGRRLVEAIVQIALGLGVTPIAEGIETAEQDRAVREIGFRAAQGRYYSAALGKDELLHALSSGPLIAPADRRGRGG